MNVFLVKLFLVISLWNHFTPHLHPNTCTGYPMAETRDLKDAVLVDTLNSWPVGQIETVGTRNPGVQPRDPEADTRMADAQVADTRHLIVDVTS